jgi:predicted transcriptional regulator
MNSWLIDTSSKRRDKLYIIAEIMEIAKDGTLKTQIMYKANLSFAQLNEYVKLLIKINLLRKEVDSGRDVYRSTEKGLDFLQRHQEIMDLLSETANSKNTLKLPPETVFKKN